MAKAQSFNRNHKLFSQVHDALLTHASYVGQVVAGTVSYFDENKHEIGRVVECSDGKTSITLFDPHTEWHEMSLEGLQPMPEGTEDNGMV